MIISDDDNEVYFSPTDEDKRSNELSSATKRFTVNFTANGEEMIDLTLDSSNPSSSVQTPDTTQQSSYPHIKLLDFLSPGVSPKDLAQSIKKRGNITPPRLFSDVSSSVLEPASAEMGDTSVVSHYGVTARSPVSDNEMTASTIRQISPPQHPDELKRATLLPPDKRVTIPVTSSLSTSTLMSPKVSIRKLDSPTNALTTSIVKGTVSVRKNTHSLQTSLNVSRTSSTVASASPQQYKFSPPVEVSSSDKASSSQGMSKGTIQHSPNISFPFSPPLTRSQRRKALGQDDLNKSKVELFTETMPQVNTDPSIDMAVADEPPKESGKKKPRVSVSEVTTTTKRKYPTRYDHHCHGLKGHVCFLFSKTKSTPRVGSNYDTILLHPMPTPGSTPSKDNVTTRKPRQKAKSMNKPPLNLRRSSRLLDSTHTDSRRH